MHLLDGHVCKEIVTFFFPEFIQVIEMTSMHVIIQNEYVELCNCTAARRLVQKRVCFYSGDADLYRQA